MKLHLLLVFVCGLFVATSTAAAQPAPPRARVLLDQPWQFKLGGDSPIPGAETPGFDDSAWQTVTVPHTWSAPGPNGYPTSANGWYRTNFVAAKKPSGERTYLFFEGAATILDVHVNGRLIGQHRGAFTAAVFDVTDALADNGKNFLAVRVSNDKKECVDCLPSTQDGSIQLYNPYGGLYRKVWLVTTPAVHIFPEMASRGVFIRQEKITAERAGKSQGRMPAFRARFGLRGCLHHRLREQGRVPGFGETNPGGGLTAEVAISDHAVSFFPDNAEAWVIHRRRLGDDRRAGRLFPKPASSHHLEFTGRGHHSLLA